MAPVGLFIYARRFCISFTYESSPLGEKIFEKVLHLGLTYVGPVVILFAGWILNGFLDYYFQNGMPNTLEAKAAMLTYGALALFILLGLTAIFLPKDE